jgi:hypothetical protein
MHLPAAGMCPTALNNRIQVRPVHAMNCGRNKNSVNNEITRCDQSCNKRAMTLGLVLKSQVAAQTFEKCNNIFGHVIDVRRIAAFEFPSFAQHFVLALRHHEHSDHAEPVRHF